MRHTREEVIQRTIQEFELLDHLVANLADDEWHQLLSRSESKDPWTVKDALAHITHWKADVARSARRQPVPAEERGLNTNQGNHLVYERWHNRSSQEVLAWHRQVHEMSWQPCRRRLRNGLAGKSGVRIGRETLSAIPPPTA